MYRPPLALVDVQLAPPAWDVPLWRRQLDMSRRRRGAVHDVLAPGVAGTCVPPGCRLRSFFGAPLFGLSEAMGMLDTMAGAKVVFQLCETCFNAHCNGQSLYSEELEDFIRAA